MKDFEKSQSSTRDRASSVAREAAIEERRDGPRLSAMLRFDSPGARSPAGPGSPFVDAGGGRESAGAGRASSSRDAPTNARDGLGRRDGNVGSVSASASGGGSTRVTTTRGGSNGGGGGGGGGKLELSATTCDELARVLESRRYGREASSLQEAVKTIDLVEHVLKRNRENLREFFSACFQPILCRLFSFDGSTSEGWMNAAFAGSERDVRELVEFLSPTGTFMRAMMLADSDKLVQFAFPLDRLPERTQRMLQTESGAMALNRSRPYAGCIKRDSVGKYQVHLGLYHYFMFWTAYFAMRPGGRRGTSSTSSSSYATRSSYGTPGGFGGSSLGGGGAFLGGQWPSTPLMNRPSSAQVHPYRELLLSHLKCFLPREAAGKNWANKTDASAMHGEILVSILTEFWMPVDNTNGSQSSDVGRGGSPFRRVPTMARVVDDAMRANGMSPSHGMESRRETRRYAYNPPAVDHVNAVTLLITYLFAELPDRRGENVEGMKTIESAREMIQRPLYCFLREAFTQWPTESSTNSEPIVTLWVAYFAPWYAKYPQTQMKSSSSTKRSGSPRAMLTSPLKSSLSSSGGSSSTARYDSFLLPTGKEHKFDDQVVDTPGQFSHVRHVLKSIPFYHELMKHFLELCCKRVPLDAEGTANVLLEVLEPLAAAPNLLKLLRDVEDGYAEFVLDPFKGTLKTMHAREETAANAESYYPLIRSQLQDWEPDVDPVNLAASLPGTPGSNANSPLSKWTGAVARLMANRVSESDKTTTSKHLRMFTPETDGLAQVAIALIHRLERDATQVPTAHALRKKVPPFRKASFSVFHLERFRDTPYLKSPVATKYVDTDSGESRQGWASTRASAKEMYRGDWMHRPIGGNEISVLVWMLVPISTFLNKKLRLDGTATDANRRITAADVHAAATESWTAARRARRENAPAEYAFAVRAVLEAVTLGMCRRKGITINLRPLAEYQMLALLFVLRLLTRFLIVVLFALAQL